MFFFGLLSYGYNYATLTSTLGETYIKDSISYFSIFYLLLLIVNIIMEIIRFLYDCVTSLILFIYYTLIIYIFVYCYYLLLPGLKTLSRAGGFTNRGGSLVARAAFINWWCLLTRGGG